MKSMKVSRRQLVSNSGVLAGFLTLAPNLSAAVAADVNESLADLMIKHFSLDASNRDTIVAFVRGLLNTLPEGEKLNQTSAGDREKLERYVLVQFATSDIFQRMKPAL